MKRSSNRALAFALSLAVSLSLPVPSARADEAGGGSSSDSAPVLISSLSMTNVGEKLILDPNPDQSREIIASISPGDATNKTLKWTSAKEAVATVSPDSGQVVTITPKSTGSSLVTVQATDGSGAEARCTVVVSGIVFSFDSAGSKTKTVTPLSTTQLSFTAYGTAEDTLSWTWQSDHPDIVSVDPVTGVISAGADEGTATITCTSDENPLYTDTCTVEVLRPATTIRTTLSGDSLLFSSLSINSKCEDATGASLSYVTSLMVSPSDGTLYYGYISDTDTGNGVAASQRYYYSGGSAGALRLSDVIFVPKPEFFGETSITYNGYSTKGQFFSGEILVTVSRTNGISYATSGDPVHFSGEDFNLYCQKENGRSLNYVRFTSPSSRYGALYYNYSSDGSYGSAVTSATSYYRASNPTIDSVTFVPAENYTGTFSLSYQGCDTAGLSYQGTVQITVTRSSSVSGSEVSYTVQAGKRVYFKNGDFNSVCTSATGYTLSYVRFSSLPSASQGTLYYIGSTRVATDTSYYYSGSSRLLSDVNFLPTDSFSGAVTIPFTGTDTRGTTFSGTVRITVSGSSSSRIVYTVSAGSRVYFDAADFSDASYSATGYELTSVRFTSLPASSQGTLYSGTGSTVSVNSSYSRSGSLSNVNFLAASSFSGTVSIPFQGTNNQGTTFTGTVEISASGSLVSSLSYTVRAGQRLQLRMEDFADACYAATGRQLNYIRFTSLPASSKGTLYYNVNTSVSTSTNYYRTASSSSYRLLEDLSFLAASNAYGSVSIPFQGYNTQGTRFEGSVSIAIEGDGPSVQVSYYTSGQAVTFRSSDFSNACSKYLDASLSKVRLSAPGPSEGKLYLNYTSPSVYSDFYSGHDYSASDLSRISFVPKAGYSGTVSLTYTATDLKGNVYTSTASIQVSPPYTSSFFSDMGSVSWAVPAVEFLRQAGIVAGTSASTYSPAVSMLRGDYVLMLSNAFNLPGAGTGSFPDVPQNSYYASAVASAAALGIVTPDAGGNFRPDQAVTRQDAGLYLYRCLLRTGKISPGSASDLTRFSDWKQVSSDAVEAMGALVRSGVFAGDGAGHLNPGDPLTRAEMAVILHQALT